MEEKGKAESPVVRCSALRKRREMRRQDDCLEASTALETKSSRALFCLWV
jgi:hypothetical protein